MDKDDVTAYKGNMDPRTLQKFAASPEAQGLLRTSRVAAANRMGTHHAQNEWILAKVERTGSAVYIKWEILPHLSEDDFFVSAYLYEIFFVPAAENVVARPLVNDSPRGELTLELEQGTEYLLQFVVLPRDANGGTRGGPLNIKFGIPLSDAYRKALGEGLILSDPVEKLRHDMQKYRRAQEAFEAMCRQEIEKIKAKRLPAEDEQRQIEDFKDYATTLKDKYGI